MLKQTKNFGYLNCQQNGEQPLINHVLVEELGSGKIRVAFSGVLYLLAQDYIERELGKCIFAIKRTNTQNDNFSISVLNFDGDEVASKQINVFATYEINEIVGQIKWTDSLILSNIYRFCFDRQQAVILISIALEESINRIQLHQSLSQTKSIQDKITSLEKQLNITSFEKKHLQKLHINERFQRLERLWKLEKMQAMSRNKKMVVNIPSRNKKIKKSTPMSSQNKSSVKKSCLKKHSTKILKQQKQIQKIDKEQGTPYQILKKSISNNQNPEIQIIQSPVQSSKQILKNSHKKRKSTGQSKMLCQQVMQQYQLHNQFQQQMAIATVSPVNNLNVMCKQQNDIIVQNLLKTQEFQNFLSRETYHKQALYIYVKCYDCKKYRKKKCLCCNYFLMKKKSILSNMIDQKSNPVKPIKVITFSFDQKVMILADTGRLFVADSQKLKVLFEVNLQDQVVFDFCLNKASQQKQGYDTFLVVTHCNVYFINTWTKENKLLLTNQNRKQRYFFKCITCLPNGDYAVGFDNGVVQIISHKNNSQLVVFSERKIPVLFLQCSNDGMFLLITDYQSITLFPIDKKRFQHHYKKKSSIKSLHLKNNFLQLLKKQKDGYETIPAKFNQLSIGKQEYIIWSFANLVLVWSLQNILNDVLQHKVFKASHIVTHAQFKYNDPTHIIVGSMKDITMHELPK